MQKRYWIISLIMILNIFLPNNAISNNFWGNMNSYDAVRMGSQFYQMGLEAQRQRQQMEMYQRQLELERQKLEMEMKIQQQKLELDRQMLELKRKQMQKSYNSAKNEDKITSYQDDSTQFDYLKKSQIGIYVNNDGVIGIIDKNKSAFRTGIRPGDKLIKINSQSIRPDNYFKINSMVNGEPGSIVVLDILRNGKELSFAVMRE